jgi:hypothetical protein
LRKEYDLDAREKAEAALKAAREATAATAEEEEEEEEEEADVGYGEKHEHEQQQQQHRRVGTGRHLGATERHLRIAKVTGISPPKEVRKLDVERLRPIHEGRAHGPDLFRLAATAKASSKGTSLRGYRDVL